jgi:putative ABC transport system substrate-binding protein
MPFWNLTDLDCTAGILGHDVLRHDFITLVGGATVAWPLAARAQKPTKPYRIAIITPSLSIADMQRTWGHPFYPAFFEELRRLGYVEGDAHSVSRSCAYRHGPIARR